MTLLQDGIKKKYVIKTEVTTKLTIDGITEIYPVYKIRLDQLYYNDRNDRIATWISQYKTENNLDVLDKTDVEKYNNIIQEFIEASNPEKLKATQNNIAAIGQQKHGIVLNDGRIIDGNRRYTCLRKLALNDSSKNYFEAVILDRNIEDNEKQIKMLELSIQIGEEARVDYDPIDKLVGIYNDIEENHLLTPHEYAQSTNMSEREVNKLVDLSKLLVEFLEFINAPKQYYLAREMDLDGPLHELQAILKKAKDEDTESQLKNIVFANLLARPEGDMTRFIRQIKSIASSKFAEDFVEKESEIAEKVLDELPANGSFNKSSLSDFRQNQNELKEELKDTMEQFTTKVKVVATKDKPNQMLKKIIEHLEDVDLDIFEKLSEDQIENINEQLDVIENKIAEIRGHLDV